MSLIGMLLIGTAYVRVKTVNEYLNQTKKDKAYKSPVIQNTTFTVMYRLTVVNGGVIPEACLLDELESNSPEKVMARKNPNKAFGLVNGEIRELSDLNTNSEHAYWTVNTDWIQKKY